jgi:hypothetical protein
MFGVIMMRLNTTLGCSICGFETKKTVNLPFDCDNLICPRCGEGNCLSIITVTENSPAAEQKLKLPSLKELYKIRLL